MPPVVRAEGLTELAGDLTFVCQGGAPTPAGQAFPQFNLTIQLNTNVTSAAAAVGQFTEALLIIDEPGSSIHPSRPILNCGNSGAPDSGASGPGVCSIVSSGDPTQDYDGTPNAFGSVLCDGSGGRPAANSYGCGRPNIFQGRLGTPDTPGQLNAITFFNVPVDPPGSGVRILRTTNLRVNATSNLAAQGYPLNQVQATISILGSPAITIANARQTVGWVEPDLAFNSGSCMPGTGSTVRVCEGFQTGWKSKNISFAVGNGIPGNATFDALHRFYWTYSGGTNYPPDVAQNVPGAIYNTESGFEWQNNSTNAPPNPNPPMGIAPVPVQQGETAPLNSAGFGGLDTGIASAGLAASGTRIALRFSGVPPGASIQVPPSVALISVSTGGTTGVAVLTNSDAAGAGLFSAASGMLPGNLAVYEVEWADPFSLEYADVPYTLINAPPGTAIQVSAGYAPFYSDSGSTQSGSTYPVPRFIDSSNACGVYRSPCLNVTPNQGLNSSPLRLSFIYFGTQSLEGAQVVLRGSGVPDIVGSNPASPSTNVLTAKFDLTNAPLGSRDVIITPPGAPAISLPGGFSVLHTPACSFSVVPSGILHVSASGSSGNLVVSPSSSECAWTASSTADWITLPPATLSVVQPYTIAPNTGSTPLSTYITVAGQNILVTQDAPSSCIFSLNASGNKFPVSGGAFTVNVTAGAGCAWSTASNLSWVYFPNGSSGSGSGSVTIQAGQNLAGFESGTLMIAGQPFAVSQDASPCGGTDVSAQVAVTQRAILTNWVDLGPWSQELQLVNNGPDVPGPLYVVLNSAAGFPSHGAIPVRCSGGVSTVSAVAISPEGISQGETILYGLQFGQSPYYPFRGTYPIGNATFTVISGAPGQ